MTRRGGDARMIRAAGGVLWRPASGGIVEVALVHRPKYDDWYAMHPGRGRTRIRELAGTGGTRVVCASGVVIRHLLAALAEDAGLALSECPARNGSVWALFFVVGELAAADYYPALT